MTPPAVVLRSLRVTLGDTVVLREIDLTVRRGTLLGYVGGNGAGKTTTFRVLAGLLEGFEGEATVAGHALGRQTAAAQSVTGFMPERGELYATLSVAETLLLAGRLHGLDDTCIRQRGEALACGLELLPMLGRRVEALSHGMHQKLLLAMALLHDPEVLLLDEPFSGLDAGSVQVVAQLLRALARRQRTILVSSHALALVQDLCDELAVLHEGRLHAVGRYDEIARTLRASSLRDLVGQLDQASRTPVEARVDAMLDGFRP